jgi:hypothetical protein
VRNGGDGDAELAGDTGERQDETFDPKRLGFANRCDELVRASFVPCSRPGIPEIVMKIFHPHPSGIASMMAIPDHGASGRWWKPGLVSR